MRAFISVFLLASCYSGFALAQDYPWLGPAFYSSEGREHSVAFDGFFRTDFRGLDQVEAMDADQKVLFGLNQVQPTLKFLFGPLTNRSIASPQRGVDLKIDWSSATLVNGRVYLKYSYSAIWILDKDAPEGLTIPVPLNRDLLRTPRWKNCTDADPQHQTDWFYWYFWDPNRPGCDHKQGIHYDLVKVRIEGETKNETESFPEYGRLLENNRFHLTFAFGYVEDRAEPNPDADWDAGALQYQAFVKQVRTKWGNRLQESKIQQNEYRGSDHSNLVIGHRFTGTVKGVEIAINIVAAAGVDQMQLFAKSFAHDHDGFFGWFGHSRVGSGFDAESFWNMVVRAPDYYSITPKYQMVYWGGCNSYSYYTLPFFEFKSHVANGSDPRGTKGLDIIANGLPSYFHLNADNASITLKHLLNWEGKPSYQTIVNELEARAKRSGIDVLVAVLGDEDNEKN